LNEKPTSGHYLQVRDFAQLKGAGSMKKLGYLVAATLVLGLSSTANAAGREFTVTMSNMTYGKLPADAKVGDTIIWVNADTVEHSATAKDGSFDLRLLPGKRGRTVLSKAGTVPIYCVMHPMMRGTLKVAG
jgi:plastocyanin